MSGRATTAIVSSQHFEACERTIQTWEFGVILRMLRMNVLHVHRVGNLAR